MSIKADNKKLLLTGLAAISAIFIYIAVISAAITVAITAATAAFVATSTYLLCSLAQWVRAKNPTTKAGTDPLKNKENSSRCTKDHSPKRNEKAIDYTIHPQTRIDSTKTDIYSDWLLQNGHIDQTEYEDMCKWNNSSSCQVG